MKRVVAVGVGVAGVLLAGWLLWPKQPVSDEDRIRAIIAAIADSAGKKDINGIAENISESYQGEAGDKRELKRYLLGFLLRSEAITVLPTNVRILEPVAGDRAKVSVVVVLARTPAKTAEEVSPDQLMGSHLVEMSFAREPGDAWRVVSASRRDATAADMLR